MKKKIVYFLLLWSVIIGNYANISIPCPRILMSSIPWCWTRPNLTRNDDINTLRSLFPGSLEILTVCGWKVVTKWWICLFCLLVTWTIRSSSFQSVISFFFLRRENSVEKHGRLIFAPHKDKFHIFFFFAFFYPKTEDWLIELIRATCHLISIWLIVNLCNEIH